MLYIKNGTLHTAVGQDTKITTFQADILIKDGKIKEIGTDLTVPDGCDTLDAVGLRIYPGFVDAHCHVGLDGTTA